MKRLCLAVFAVLVLSVPPLAQAWPYDPGWAHPYPHGGRGPYGRRPYWHEGRWRYGRPPPPPPVWGMRPPPPPPPVYPYPY
ncbi:hypothetical protein [Komagataeibacter saccharivorans]|uniref:hypothetical protein n=1 Tax=Komagataeibacter saccharivorans TaxID=265959 RepID=UPI0011AFB039|nr:hypothetical protein [Komagataeibacter saccharivorans]